jgi:crotonobetainyl-CoA:carnitine CoA-transferase CaiB-like acyl-CoA transferase
MAKSAPEALHEAWTALGGAPGDADRVAFTGADPMLPSCFAIGAIAGASIGAAALAAAELRAARSGPADAPVEVDLRHAAAAFRSERYLRIDGAPAPDPWNAIAGHYETADGWVQLHTNFEHHLAAALGVLGLPMDATRDDATAAIKTWEAAPLEDAIVGAGGCAATYRSPAAWEAMPQAAAIAELPLVRTELGAPGAPRDPGPPTRPLSGVRVLDLTRVIAGPVAGRTLTAQGAQVLRVGASHLPEIPATLVDTGFGKRSTLLDLRDAQDAQRMRELVRESDALVQSYRPGALDVLGFGPDALHELNPALVVVSVSAYGEVGPWHDRRGFDSLVQTGTGIAWTEAQVAGVDRPRPLPAQALDHATGYLAAAAVTRALTDRRHDARPHRCVAHLARPGRRRPARARSDRRRGRGPLRRDAEHLRRAPVRPARGMHRWRDAALGRSAARARRGRPALGVTALSPR